MAVTSAYSNTYVKEIVTVDEIGSKGARCSTSYGAEIIVQWGANLPSPVPQLGERWYVDRISPSKWAFDAKITGTSYNLMRYSMELDMWSCVGRERSTVDDIAQSGASEVYLTVAEGGVVYWDSEVAKNHGLKTFDVDDEPFDYVRQVVSRCVYNNLSVVFVIDCNLWSDVKSKVHNYYQQVRLSPEYVGQMGWYSLLSNVWDDVDNYTWDSVRNAKVKGDGDSEHVATWSFLTARQAVKELVDELYDRYSDSVRGVCFRNWCVDGAYADASPFMASEFAKTHDGTLLGNMATDRLSDRWWASRMEMLEFFGDMQRGFIAHVKQDIGNWPVSVIVPAKTLCLSSERMGRFDTWLDDDFSSYGWSKVGCLLDYSRSIDTAYELRSFEFLVASLRRFAEDASPLYRIDIQSTAGYDGMLNVLSKYNVTNVLLDDYEHWKLLSDQQVIDLKNAMNANSVTPITTTDEVGFYVSSNSRDIAYHDDVTPNRFQSALQDFCITLLDRLPHRLRVYYDGDMEYVDNVYGVSAMVMFHALNMSYEAVEAVNYLLDMGGVHMVIAGRCGMYTDMTLSKRTFLPFLDRFGESDFGVKAYEVGVEVAGGRIGVFSEAYVMNGECVGINPVMNSDPDADGVDVVGTDSNGDKVVAPIYFNNRSSIIAMDIVDEPSLMQMASEMVLLAIGRDR